MNDTLDTMLLDRIRQGYKCFAFICAGDAYREASRQERDTGIDANALAMSHLQSMQKRGLVDYDADKGWSLSANPPKQEEPSESRTIKDLKRFFLNLLFNTPGRYMRDSDMAVSAEKVGIKEQDGVSFVNIFDSLEHSGKIVKLEAHQRAKASGTMWQLAGVWS